MQQPKCKDPVAQAFRDLFCWVFCSCKPAPLRPVLTLKDRSSGFSISFDFGEILIMDTTVDGGPFELSVDKFVDDKGNTTTDTDIPVWAITGNAADGSPLATLVAPSTSNPQGATLTLAGKVGAINITAAFGDQSKLGTPGNYLLQGSLGVAPGQAVAGSIEVTGPGVTGAAP